MKERPILFSGEMVKAILEGRKTQTRRIMRPQPIPWDKEVEEAWWSKRYKTKFWWSCNDARSMIQIDELNGSLAGCGCPYGYKGSKLWVRETWQAVHFEKDFETGIVDDLHHANHIPRLSNDGYWAACYEAEKKWPLDSEERGFPWRPSIHMPRWASRILLEIVSVRVERLQDISEEDAIAEGVLNSEKPLIEGGKNLTVMAGFIDLWESLNGPGSWEKNPWVWRIEFKRVTP